MATLAKDYKLRHPTMQDLDPVSKLIDITSAAMGDEGVSITAEELAQWWRSSDLDRDIWVVESPTGEIVGYEEFEDRFEHSALAGDGYVHPAHYNKGIGTTMLTALVERAKEEIPLAPPNLRVFVRNGFGAEEYNAMEVYKDLGFFISRYHWRMRIDLNDSPQPTSLPDGLRYEPFDVDKHDRQLWEAHHDAFKDHWGHVTRPYEYWVDHVRGFPEFNPALWLVVWDGDQIAGYALNREKTGKGWVGTLGVRRAWRKRGLGFVLLNDSFRALHNVGLTEINLSVDSENPSGATRLYEKAGMKIANTYIVVDKTLRDGEDPTDG